MKHTSLLGGLVLGVLVTLPSCGRTTAPDRPTAQSESGSGGGSGTSGATSGAGTSPGPEPPLCMSGEPTAAPIRLLDDRQLSHVAALFEETLDTSWPRPPSRIHSEAAPLASTAFVERQLELATRIARKTSGDPALFARVIECDLAGLGAEACLPQLKDFVLKRLFRGLAPEGTAEELDAVYQQGVELGGDAPSGLRAVLEVALQSPEFLYRVEHGRPANEAGGWAEPTPREMASRLSFLLWDRGPDDELLTAADANQLSEPEQLAAHARRLLQDARARDVVRRFYEELLFVGYADTSNPRAPDLTPGLYAAMRSELGAFVEAATFDGAGDFAALFAPTTWLNASLSEFYGLSPVSGSHFRRVELDGARYAGLLTQGAWLASIGSDYTSPTRRGLMLSRALLCREVPPEPPDLPLTQPVPPPAPATTRERLAAHVSEPTCRACHQLMDPYGLALEHFDTLGRWRDDEDGLPIDTVVELYEGDRVSGAAELAGWFLDQPSTRGCFVQNWRRFAFGRARALTEDCEYAELRRQFHDSGENVVELLVALTQTPTFRYLGKAPP